MSIINSKIEGRPGKKRILIVDDNAVLRKELRSILSSQENFIIVGEAGDGLEAIESVENFHPDLVLMDISMPRMNGLEATREIKKRRPETIILALTLYDQLEFSTAALRAGADDYITKDAHRDELLQSIQNSLSGGKSSPSNGNTKISR